MKTGKPYHGSGKTYFNRIKQRGVRDNIVPGSKPPQRAPLGESWVDLREQAIRAGKFKMPVPKDSTPAMVAIEESSDGTPVAAMLG